MIGIGAWLFLGIRSRCPNCGRLFARNIVRKEVTKRSILLMATEELQHYECKYCHHNWKKLVSVNND
ncbi:MAG: hypothetical protein HC802_10375 [Caldilineaceae bacterium]|nr:hypothetical protein [Caldilineaceae bacterium]